MEETSASHRLFSSSDPNSDYASFNFAIDSYFIERGPRYEAYSRLRESKLRMRSNRMEEEDIAMPLPDLSPSPLMKSVRFQKRKASRPPAPSFSSVVAQSVPDFSSALRKENRRPPPVNRLTDKATTPPPSMVKRPKMYESASKKRMAARKSYASIEELKGLSAAAEFSIAGENRGGRGGGRRVVGRRSVLRQSVQFY